MDLLGIHHVTAVSARIRENHHFYTRTLGMRLVKRSVNQDDVSAYHLFYADAVGSPGTDLTFFDWPVAPERRGTRSIVRVSLRVNGAAVLEWWRDYLREQSLPAREIVERHGRLVLDFEDREGQRLSLVDDGGAGPSHPWDRSPIAPEHQIRGLGPVVLSVPRLEPTDQILQKVLNMRLVHEHASADNPSHRVHVYEIGAGGPGAEVHLLVQPDMAAAHPGAGGVHHVAFRTPDADYDAWADRLNAMRVPNSGKIDRFWFHSLYFREPNGILFEIASDGPGFGVDEPQATLGEHVVLPPFFEPQREAIVANLKPID